MMMMRRRAEAQSQTFSLQKSYFHLTSVRRNYFLFYIFSMVKVEGEIFWHTKQKKNQQKK